MPSVNSWLFPPKPISVSSCCKTREPCHGSKYSSHLIVKKDLINLMSSSLFHSRKFIFIRFELRCLYSSTVLTTHTTEFSKYQMKHHVLILCWNIWAATSNTKAHYRLRGALSWIKVSAFCYIQVLFHSGHFTRKQIPSTCCETPPYPWDGHGSYGLMASTIL